MKQNILITGAGGFIGKNLSEGLRNKYNVLSMNHSGLNLLNADEVNLFFKNNHIDVVIHCANTGGSRKTFYDGDSNNVVESNLRMFLILFNCMKPGMRMINLGSGAEYDKSRNLSKVREDEFGYFVPHDSYGFSKYLISKLIENRNDIICLRIFGLYGKYEDYSYKFISNSIVKNIFHLPIEINQNVIFDYLYIRDFINIIISIIEKWPGINFMNVTPTESIDLITIANIINHMSSFKSEISILNEGLNKMYTGDNSALLDSFSINFTSYEDGIAELYSYYETIINKIDKKKIELDPYLKYCKKTIGN